MKTFRQTANAAVLATLLALGCSRADTLGVESPAEEAASAFETPAGIELAAVKVKHDRKQVLVRLRPGVSLTTINARYGTSQLDRLQSEPSFLLKTPANKTVEDLLPAMTADPDLEVAEPNFQTGNPEAQRKSGGSLAFADPSLKQADFVDQAALARIRAPEAQAIARGAGVIVAVLDTGVQLNHPRLAQSIAPGGVDLVDGDADPSDSPDGVDSDKDGIVDEAVGHGTFVAGMVLAVAPKASILPIRVLDSDGFGTAFAVARGIEVARNAGARVVNMSLGMSLPSGVVDGLIERFKNQDVVFVSSAGNASAEKPQQFPARDSYVIGTAATDDQDRKTDFSNFGSWVDVSAPGEGLVGYFPTSAYAHWSGTSFSAGLVSGEAALLISARPGARFNDVVDAIERTAKSIDNLNPGFRGRLGSGRIDVLAAVRLIRG
ncbi:MAG TPA: S8 family serine peptidase [Gemmatimonadota bacterium]